MNHIYYEGAFQDLPQKLSASLLPEGTPKYVEIRSVIHRDRQGGWRHIASLAQPTVNSKPDPQILYTEPAALIIHAVEIQSLSTAGDLASALTLWQSLVGVPGEQLFQQSISFMRLRSRNEWSDYPISVAKLYLDGIRHSEIIQDKVYFSSEHRLFATSIGNLAYQWLGCPEVENHRGNDDYYWLALPDARARIEWVAVDDLQLTVEIAGIAPPSPVHLGINWSDYHGKSTATLLPMDGTTAAYKFTSIPRELGIFLLSDSAVLDWYQEGEVSTSWGDPVLRSKRGEEIDATAAFSAAVANGETDRIEFKAWIAAASPDKKSNELLKSCVAFANNAGGSVYIGISDEGEPIGIETPLRKDYEQSAKGDVSKMKDSYVQHLRSFISEGTNPSISPQFQWIEVARRPLLKITIASDERIPFSIPSSGDIYIRAGATNRKMRHSDALALLERRRVDAASAVRSVMGGRRALW